MNPVLFKAILAMDSYSRGYDEKVSGLESPDPNIDNGSQIIKIGNASIITDSHVVLDGRDEDAEFYAVAYEMDGEIIVSYRGTDLLPQDAINGWTTGGGGYNYLGEQALMSAEFLKAVLETTSPNDVDISFTGHSLGGGLAGLMGSLYHKEAVVFDNMPYNLASSLIYAHSVVDTEVSEFIIDILEEFYDDYDANQPIEHNESVKNHYYFNNANIIEPDSSQVEQIAVVHEVLSPVRIILKSDYDTYYLDSDAFEGALDLHSQALLVNLLFAQQEYATGGMTDDWRNISDEFIDTLYSSDIAIASESTNADIMLNKIAYSAISEGTTIFGDTAIHALWNDANDLGKVVGAGNLSRIFKEEVQDGVVTLDDSLVAISKIFTQYAGQLATDKIETEVGDAIRDGVLEIGQNGAVLVIDVSSDTWTNGLYVPNIIGRDELVSELISGELKDIITNGWGNYAEKLLDKILLSTRDTGLFMVTPNLIEATDSHTLIVGDDGGTYNIFGTFANDIILGKSGSDTIDGGYGNDIIDGGNNHDSLSGGEGNDTLLGGVGNDILLGGNGSFHDVLDGGEGNDILHSGEGHDTLTGGTQADTFIITADTNYATITDFGKVTIHTEPGYDKIDLTAFSDYVQNNGDFYINYGVTFYDGTSGAQIYVRNWDVHQYYVTINLHDIELDELTLDDFIGLDPSISLTSNGNDEIINNDGDATILINTVGNDSITGGDGEQVFEFSYSNGTKVITDFNLNEDRIDLSNLDPSIDAYTDLIITDTDEGALISFDFDAEQSILLHDIEASEINASHFIGNASTTLFGLGSLDDDYIQVSASGTNGVRFETYAGDDTVYATVYNDTILGGSGDNLLFGNGGNDFIGASAGTDTVYGGSGADVIDGGDGDNYLYGDAGNDTLTGGSITSGGDELPDSGSFGGTVGGSAGGSSGSGGGNITYVEQFDYLSGGEGTDTFSINNRNNSKTTIEDFELTEQIDLTFHNSFVYDFDGLTMTQLDTEVSVTTESGTVVETHSEVVISLEDNQEVILKDTTIDELSASNFIFGNQIIPTTLILGTDSSDFLQGDSNNNFIYGNAGDDTIDGVGGSYNELFGGEGNDLLYSNIGVATLRGENGNDTVLHAYLWIFKSEY